MRSFSRAWLLPAICLSFGVNAEEPHDPEFRHRIGHLDAVSSVTFSADGTYVVSGSHDRTVKLWEAGTGRLIRTFIGHTLPISSIAVSPDGSRILSGGNDTTLKLWNTTTGDLLHTFPGNSYLIFSVAFSPNCQEAAMAQ
jgi:WD40 repeat protein